ncbi:glycosyltransferase family 1 protein [Lederbergia wuyishanensis]|uniref:Glycosyltransferase EpsF n=1 Tax=Lederbergia wuyishanensis TaxID=1347903 RepID=A0ABU0D363_9BACI|nr:glycosyltransferase family 1 protein [Lederbergia wuyishanensis]MCJ8007992.1 glycosyltransferase family 1 protein [Lederbergia wuyishanensis]MDQ0342837.1 glycosyltransferase EpsF [Lederbergia wuyishanensis]
MSKEPYRILHVFATLNCGGAETRIMDIYKQIDRNKIQFDFVAFTDGPYYYEKEIKELGGRIFIVRNPRKSLIGHVLDLYKIMKKEGPFQAVHAHTSYHGGIVMIAARFAGIRFRICHARTTSSISTSSPIRKLILSLGRKLISTNATSFLAVSKSAGIFLFGKKNVANNRVKIVPNSINIEKYMCINELDSEKLRSHLGIPKTSIVIGHVGRFEKMKNHNFIIDIFKEIINTGIEAKLVLVGEGSLVHDIKEKVARQNIEDHVIFTGLRNDVPNIMKMLDILVMPSLYEGLPGTVLEAQAAGTPCVLSENITKEVDMGLGLVTFLNLSLSSKEWGKSILDFSSHKKLKKQEIYLAFQQKRFTLEYTVNSFKNVYGL